MLPRRVVSLLQVGLLVAFCPVVAHAATQQRSEPSRASQYFLPSRHMALSQIHSGMVGYGITAMPGNPIARFGVKIVDVLYDFAGPGRHVILAECNGAGLEKTGILAGMSGSPVYMPDPKDNNKPKLIGAVAYGWSFNKEPLCGIQPIQQMLAAKESAPVGNCQQVSAYSTGVSTEALRKSDCRLARGGCRARSGLRRDNGCQQRRTGHFARNASCQGRPGSQSRTAVITAGSYRRR